jgi:hypothetical protein
MTSRWAPARGWTVSPAVAVRGGPKRKIALDDWHLISRILSGDGDGRLLPAKPATRDQLCPYASAGPHNHSLFVCIYIEYSTQTSYRRSGPRRGCDRRRRAGPSSACAGTTLPRSRRSKSAPSRTVPGSTLPVKALRHLTEHFRRSSNSSGDLPRHGTSRLGPAHQLSPSRTAHDIVFCD